MGGTPPFGLSRDDWGRLVLIDASGRRFVGVEPVRAFPLSDPSRGISLCEESGKEVAWIDRLDDLPSATKSLLMEHLEGREFLPRIERIVSISSDSAPSDWRVETDRGPTVFTLEDEEQIRKVGPHRALLTDSRGMRFEVRDVRALDPASRMLLDRYL